MKAIFEILDFIKMKKSDASRQKYDRIYNLKNGRSSHTPKKSVLNFDIDSVKFSKPQEMMLPEGPEGSRGSNKQAGLD